MKPDVFVNKRALELRFPIFLGVDANVLASHGALPFRLLFSNGGPCHPPFDRTDCVHQIAPIFCDEALRAGESAERHFLVPYGIKMCEAPVIDPAARQTLRARHHLPLDRPVVLSVGWISRTHKRMDYLVEEVARLPQPRPFVQMLGAMDDSSREVVEHAQQLLGRDGFSARSVSYDEVSDYYRTADVFALSSLQEAFGRVYVEALMYGLPVIAHRHPVMEYVLGGEGWLGDLNRPGVLAQLLAERLRQPSDAEAAQRRWRSVRDRFDWPVLSPAYLEMFRVVAQRAKYGASG